MQASCGRGIPASRWLRGRGHGRRWSYLPGCVDVGDPPGRKDEIRRPVAHHLVSDLDIAGLRIPSLRYPHHKRILLAEHCEVDGDTLITDMVGSRCVCVGGRYCAASRRAGATEQPSDDKESSKCGIFGLRCST